MHVIVLNQYAAPVTEGGLTRHIELFERLPGPWTFEIVAGNRSSQTRQRHSTTDSNFRFIEVPEYGERNGLRRILGWLAFSLKAICYGLRAKRPDIVFASSPHLLTAIAGLILARARRAKFVLEIRDIWPESLVEFGYLKRGSFVHRILLRQELFLYKNADHIVVVTGGWSEYFSERGVTGHRMTVITNGADTKSWAPRKDVMSLAERLGVDGPIAVYAGAHGVPNGLEYILSAAQKHPEVTFAFYGDGVLKSRHIERMKADGLKNVVFNNPVPKTELATFLWTADIGIHTLADIDLFKVGMSPNKLYDYMAAGIPVVTNAGGIAEQILKESRAGFGVPSDAVSEGVALILSLSPEERREMGARGRQWIDENASRSAMSARLEKTLESLSPVTKDHT